MMIVTIAGYVAAWTPSALATSSCSSEGIMGEQPTWEAHKIFEVWSVPGFAKMGMGSALSLS